MGLFDIKSVAVVGASPKEGKVGNIILKNFIERFKGKIFPVNPKYKEIFGLKCYESVLDIKEKIDLAVIAIPAGKVPEIVKQCSKKKVKLVIIISAGFSEIGRKDLEEKILENKGKVRIIGPNCMGIYDPYQGIDTFFVEDSRVPRPGKGNITILSQSGAIALAMMEWLALHKIGVSKIISYGNKVDLDEVDLLKELEKDKNTKYIFIYLEGLKEKRGREFVKVAKKLYEKGKRIVVLKAGKTKRGKIAISSHTASMAGEYEVYKFAFQQAKIIEAKNMDEFLLYLKGISYFQDIKGKKVCVYTNGGGEGVLASDILESLGFEIPETLQGTKNKLKKVLPAFASLHNPIDTTAQASEEQYLEGLKIILESKDFDLILAILLPQLPWYSENFPEKFKKIYKKQKPVFFVIYGGFFAKKIREKLEEVVPVFENPCQAGKAMKIFLRK